ncbi:MAG TPA: hypothetical protein VHF50_06890 [Solirubrobacterales bacterium]|nr:hypothetical protein [Solirubrobacterales bacterium]
MIVVVTAVGNAGGSRAAAAALACAGSVADRASLLIDLEAARSPRPSLVATAAARTLEGRLTAHLPGAEVASRGRICQLALRDDSQDRRASVEQVAAALPLVRDSLAVVHLPQSRFQTALVEPRIRPSGALLCADLAVDRPLTALAVGDLMGRGIEVVVLKQPLGWLVARAAELGALPDAAGVLPRRAARLLP